MSRNQFPREFYIGKTYVEHTRADDVEAIVYVALDRPKPCAMAFSAKRNKPDFHFSFSTIEKMEAHIASYLDGLRKSKEFKAKRRADRKAEGRGLEVGDICRTCWGYDQTNVEYYQVTRLIGSTMVEVREIAQEVEETQWMAGKCVPVPGKFVGPAVRKVAKGGRVKMSDWGRWASKCAAQEVAGVKVYDASYWSSYA